MGRSKSRKGKGKKGKKGKKAELSDDEKRRLAEQKLLAEKEKLAARQALTKAFLKVKKDKEYELVKLNQNKILGLWRPHLRKLKIKELLDEYEHMRLAFQKAYDKKSQWINDMNDQIGKNDADYQTATDNHLYQIDRMIEFYKMRMREVQRLYDEAKGNLYALLDYERRRIQKSHNEKMEDMQKAMDDMKNAVIKADQEARMEMFSKIVEMRTQGNQELYIFRLHLTEKVNQVWDNLHQRILGYVNTNADKKEELISLMAKDEDTSKSIDALYHRRAILIEGIQQMKDKRASFEEEYSKYNHQLLDNRQQSKDRYTKLMEIRTQTLNGTKFAISDLSLIVHSVVQDLTKVVKQRERVVNIASRILDAETDVENFDPFLERWGLGCKSESESWNIHLSKDTENEQCKTKGTKKFTLPIHEVIHHLDCCCEKCRCEKDDDEGEAVAGSLGDMVNSLSKLNRFWIRFNKVALEREAIFKERELALKDNQELKVCVRHYMSKMNPPGLESFNFVPDTIEENTKKIGEFIERLVQRKLWRECSQQGYPKDRVMCQNPDYSEPPCN